MCAAGRTVECGSGYPFSPATSSSGLLCAIGCGCWKFPASSGLSVLTVIPLPCQSRTSKRFAHASPAANSSRRIGYLRRGQRVRVLSGPLEGLTGIVVRQKNRTRFVISLELLMRSVAVEIDSADFDPNAALQT